VQLMSRALFGVAGLALMVLSLGMILQGLYQPFAAFLRSGLDDKTVMLEAVGYVIIAVAVFDVARFLIEEEVVLETQKRKASEARRSLTKFVSTIVIAVFLESLVTVFRVSTERIAEMLYPTFLFLAGTLLILTLGVYQRLSATVEQQVEDTDPEEEPPQSA
jgi:hypothetical protein